MRGERLPRRWVHNRDYRRIGPRGAALHGQPDKACRFGAGRQNHHCVIDVGIHRSRPSRSGGTSLCLMSAGVLRGAHPNQDTMSPSISSRTNASQFCATSGPERSERGSASGSERGSSSSVGSTGSGSCSERDSCGSSALSRSDVAALNERTLLCCGPLNVVPLNECTLLCRGPLNVVPLNECTPLSRGPLSVVPLNDRKVSSSPGRPSSLPCHLMF